MAKGKGAGIVWGVFLLMVVVVVGLGAYLFNVGGVQQTALSGGTPAEVQQNAVNVAAGLKDGDASTYRFVTYDKESPTGAQVATQLYVEQSNGDGSSLNDNVSLSATAYTSVSTAIGKHLKACAFDDRGAAVYYGVCKELDVTKESQDITLDVYRAVGEAAFVDIDCFKDGSAQPNSQCNVTLSASGSYALDYLKFGVNTSDRTLNFKMLGFDTTAESNISDIDAVGPLNFEGISASGSLIESMSMPERLRNTLNWAFVVPNAILLHEDDYIKTSAIRFTADGDDPPNEAVTIYVIDEQMFKSTKGATANTILSGVEDDRQSPVNVGAPDVTRPIGVQ